MKSKVRLSIFSLMLTLIATTVLIAGTAILIWNGENKAFIAAIVLFLALISGMVYAPMSISVDDSAVAVRFLLRRQKLPISDIESIELFQPTMGSIRIFGSGGYMGYWGIFREGDIGKYVAYYGKSSDCFLIRMKNGDRYVLGCENPDEMVKYINSRLEINNQTR